MRVFKNSVILITGGTGSFGKTVLRRFLNEDVREIRIFSRDEKKQEDLRLEHKSEKLRFIIGDVRDADSVSSALSGVDFVFHAAALKQVPSCEFYPMEAVKTNVLGTANVLGAAVANGVKKLILLSTDKAVYPINAMGMSKAMAEKLLVAKSRLLSPGSTVLCATRYGNVMGSRGSVIPLFMEQVLGGQPLTITDPKMTRFLMSLDESVDLVMHAFENGRQGDIYVYKAPGATVENIAIALKKIFNSNNPLRIIGTRHGEKLFESLVSREEMLKVEEVGDFYRIPADNRSLNYDKYFSEGDKRISDAVDYTSHNTQRLAVEDVIELLMKLEFVRNKLDD